MTRLALRELATRELGRNGVKAGVSALLRSVGGHVLNLSEGKPRWKRPPGLPDLLVLLPRWRCVAFVETKTPRGGLSEAQRAFGEQCAECDVAVIVGGEREVRAWLIAIGALTEGAGA